MSATTDAADMPKIDEECEQASQQVIAPLGQTLVVGPCGTTTVLPCAAGGGGGVTTVVFG
jgi:hypothetical protein